MELLTKQQMRERLKKDLVKFQFIKKDGTIRVAVGTTNDNFIPEANRGQNQKENTFFDIELGKWRSMAQDAQFVIESTIKLG